jgi:hypothetical protein
MHLHLWVFDQVFLCSGTRALHWWLSWMQALHMVLSPLPIGTFMV